MSSLCIQDNSITSDSCVSELIADRRAVHAYLRITQPNTEKSIIDNKVIETRKHLKPTLYHCLCLRLRQMKIVLNH